MARLSVNINKIALLRNSRGIDVPNLIQMVQLIIDAGVTSLTVHPRADARHITFQDVYDLSMLPLIKSGTVEFNIEADLRAEAVELVKAVKPTQYTIVPTDSGELTSTRGWRDYDDQLRLNKVVCELRSLCRLSLFCDPDVVAVERLKDKGVHALEINTRLYAESWLEGKPRLFLEAIAVAAQVARASGLRLNGGHDLTTDNLPMLLARVDFDELSIGHHLTSQALLGGLVPTVQEYLRIVEGKKI